MTAKQQDFRRHINKFRVFSSFWAVLWVRTCNKHRLISTKHWYHTHNKASTNVSQQLAGPCGLRQSFHNSCSDTTFYWRLHFSGPKRWKYWYRYIGLLNVDGERSQEVILYPNYMNFFSLMKWPFFFIHIENTSFIFPQECQSKRTDIFHQSTYFGRWDFKWYT